MARRFLGTDPTEIQEALAALRGAQTFRDLELLVESLPALQTPAFHATLRQLYLHPPGTGDDSARAAFTALYDNLIYLLHRQSYSGICRRDLVDHRGVPGPASYQPALHRAVREALTGYIVPPLGTRPLDPHRDKEQLQELLCKVRGNCPPLPDYETEPGISWALLAAECPRCRSTRLISHVHALDLDTFPGLEESLREGRFEDAECPGCGSVCCQPSHVLLADQPQSSDPLSALACTIKLAPGMIIFRPPPGTPDLPELRRLLEMRFDRQLERTGWGRNPGITSRAVVYSLAELCEAIDRFRHPTDIPHQMRQLIEEIASKLRTGQISFADAESLLDRASPAMADWPLAAASVQDSVGYEWHHLSQALIAERVASAQARPSHIRALLAINKATAYISLYEYSAAEQSLDRADEILASADPDDPDAALVRTAAAHHRADLLDGLGEPEAADLLRDSNDQFAVIPTDSPFNEIARLDIRLRQGAQAAGSGDIQGALAVLPGVVAELRRASGETQSAEQPGLAIQSFHTHRLCGALGNLAATLRELARHLDTIREAPQPRPSRARPSVPDPAVSASLIAKLRPTLWRLFPAGFSPEQVREAAIGLLREGIAMAQEVGTWEFAAIQGHHLTLLLDATGQFESARDWARRTSDFSARIGDHARLAASQAYLAEAAIAAGQGSEAMAYLTAAALESVRQAVGQGYRADSRSFEEPLADGVIRAVASGGRELTGILVLESMKAATTAATLLTGLPTAADDSADQPLAALADEAHRTRERLRLRSIWDPDDEDLARKLASADERLAMLRRKRSLRSPDFIKWISANDVYLTDELALVRRLTRISSGSRYLGFFRIGPVVYGYLLGAAGSCRMVKHVVPEADADPVAGMALAADLMEPFADELASLGHADRLIISPDLTLLGLPFPAASVAGAPLCAHTTSSFVHGTGMLEALGERRRRQYDTAAVLGAPARPDLPDLQNARSEVLAVREFFGDGPTLTGTAGTVPALIVALSDVDVLHIACHAVTEGVPDSGSRLMLAPDILAVDSGELSEDRILAELPVPQGCLVNLSGCRTAHQKKHVGPLLAGLVPAFLAKGAGSVLAALWPIEDQQAMIFNAEFYRILRQNDNPAGALASCQQAAASGQLGDEMKAPLAWAGYVLYGV